MNLPALGTPKMLQRSRGQLRFLPHTHDHMLFSSLVHITLLPHASHWSLKDPEPYFSPNLGIAYTPSSVCSSERLGWLLLTNPFSTPYCAKTPSFDSVSAHHTLSHKQCMECWTHWYILIFTFCVPFPDPHISKTRTLAGEIPL